jgi:hypothetical protein
MISSLYVGTYGGLNTGISTACARLLDARQWTSERLDDRVKQNLIPKSLKFEEGLYSLVRALPYFVDRYMVLHVAACKLMSVLRKADVFVVKKSE